MTYGQNTHELRDSMAWLLGRHRILQRLDDEPGYTRKASSTEAERERMGQTILRYRHVALTWCLEAVTAATPKTDLTRTTRFTRNPEEDLRYRLRTAVDATRHLEPLTELLATDHHNDLLDAWQRVARGAALGEHDFAAGVNYQDLTPEQSRTVLKDAATLTQALVILDKRYRNVPGWQHLTEPTRLGRAAEQTTLLADQNPRDPSVDAHGWRPAPGLIEGPALPGVAGAVQAQHNLLVDLARLPNALNLRRVLHSQAQASHEAAKHAATAAPELVKTFSHRALLYQDLVRTSRDIGGLVGGGGHAVIESQNAATRLQHVPARGVEARESLTELARLCTRTDSRVAATIEHGLNEKLYFVSVNVPQLTEVDHQRVRTVGQRWIPFSSTTQTRLLPLVREQLRPPPMPPQVSAESEQNRAAYEAMLTQQIARVGHAGPSR